MEIHFQFELRDPMPSRVGCIAQCSTLRSIGKDVKLCRLSSVNVSMSPFPDKPAPILG